MLPSAPSSRETTRLTRNVAMRSSARCVHVCSASQANASLVRSSSYRNPFSASAQASCVGANTCVHQGPKSRLCNDGNAVLITGNPHRA